MLGVHLLVDGARHYLKHVIEHRRPVPRGDGGEGHADEGACAEDERGVVLVKRREEGGVREPKVVKPRTVGLCSVELWEDLFVERNVPVLLLGFSVECECL